MSSCASCSSPLADFARFCSRCGASADPASLASTRVAGEPVRMDEPRGAIPRAGVRFLPGAILAGRFRIVELLGRGGMGEVFRADDLKLGHPVAVKLLPESLSSSPDRLDRFFNEVKLSRQVSHPNVCRVHDVGEMEGLHFLSMEYIDGEDLASLLRRIGRLPGDKAVEIARQICAGLAAAHDHGILHRDLKPSNIMIDGRGRARITDFGLAGLAQQFAGAEIKVGTPAYMSPEQLEGREVTVRSDIYSLGLVLYELFTGKGAFEGDTLAEITRLHRESRPTDPSFLVNNLDPIVETVILRCLEKNPGERPPSALAVAAALPGGDPLAAALAAGETPSPEMVAAAGKAGALRPAAAWSCLAAVLAGLVIVALVRERTSVLGLLSPPKPPQVLAERAREALGSAGHSSAPADWAYGFSADNDYLRWLEANRPAGQRWDLIRSGRPPALVFWYRESPRHLTAYSADRVVRLWDPPPVVSGMATVVMDTQGRLLSLTVVPPQVPGAPGQAGPPEALAGGEDPQAALDRLMRLAGLEAARFSPAESLWSPPVYADSRLALSGTLPEAPDAAIRIETAGFRGRPVYFETVGPWTRPARMLASELSAGIRVGLAINVLLILCSLVGAIVLARRNLRLGRGDRRGAFRVGLFLFLATVTSWMLNAHHGHSVESEWAILTMGVAIALFVAGILWVLYVALEPYVRRRSPDSIIAWSRLLSGRWRDPLVGRDALIGAALGVALALAGRLIYLAADLVGLPGPSPVVGFLRPLLGARFVASQILDVTVQSLVSSMFLLLFYFLSRMGRAGRWPGTLIFFGVAGLLNFLFQDSGHPLLRLAVAVTTAGLLTLVMGRFGLLATFAALFFAGFEVPITFDAGVWYAPGGFAVLLLLSGLAVHFFVTSLGGRPALGALAPQE